MKNRPNFLSPIVKKVDFSSIPKPNKIILSPVRYNINGLCLKLKNCLRQRKRKIPVKFTFNLVDVTNGYMPDTNINLTEFVYDYKTFPISKTKIISARELSKRIYGFRK